MPEKSINYIGQKFGKLTITGVSEKQHYIICKCDCGTVKEQLFYNVIKGKSKSCGCNVIKHNMRWSPEYIALREIKYRCNTPSCKHYPGYGGRGITVCDRWQNSFENFYSDMGPRPSESHSIDRIDNNKGYSPENCRWATQSQQCNNRRGTVRIEYAGVIMPLSTWAKVLGIRYGAICQGLLSSGYPMSYYIDKYLHSDKKKGRRSYPRVNA